MVNEKLKLSINTLRPRQIGCHYADNIFKCIFLNEKVWIPIKISLKFVPKGLINKKSKPLSEPMMIPDAYMHHLASMS